MPTPDETTLHGTSEDWHEEQLFEVNGEKVALEELKKGYMRQADYTRKTQELKKSSTTSYDEEELNNFRQLMQQEGYVKKDDLETVKQRLKQEQEFELLVQSDPELKRLQPAIQALAENTWKSYEQVIEEYKLLSSSKLAKAKERSLVGDRNLEEKTKTLDDMTPEEWASFQKSIKTSPFTKTRSI